MNYLTNYYKNICENLEQKIAYLNHQLNEYYVTREMRERLLSPRKKSTFPSENQNPRSNYDFDMDLDVYKNSDKKVPGKKPNYQPFQDDFPYNDPEDKIPIKVQPKFPEKKTINPQEYDMGPIRPKPGKVAPKRYSQETTEDDIRKMRQDAVAAGGLPPSAVDEPMPSGVSKSIIPDIFKNFGNSKPKSGPRRAVTQSGKVISINDPGYHPDPGNEGMLDGSGRRNEWRDKDGNIHVSYGVRPVPRDESPREAYVEIGDDFDDKTTNPKDYFDNKKKNRPFSVKDDMEELFRMKKAMSSFTQDEEKFPRYETGKSPNVPTNVTPIDRSKYIQKKF